MVWRIRFAGGNVYLCPSPNHLNAMVMKSAFLVLIAVTSINSQCPGTPEITSVTDDVCQVLQGSLSYLCRDNGGSNVVWTSSVWTGNIVVLGGVPLGSFPTPNVSGVTLSESSTLDVACINSTLTFNGDLTALTALNGATLTCDTPADPEYTVNITVNVPVFPDPPVLMNVPSTTCGNMGNQVTLQWTPPTNTGGHGVVITHYNITGLPQSANCSTGPCDMIDGTATTITGLQCNDDSNVTVSAVNCRGVGNASDSVMITVDVPDSAAPSFNETPCFDGNNISVSLTMYANSCLSNLMFVVSSNCSTSEQVVMVSQTDVTVKMLPASANDYCEVTAFVRSDCGNSSKTTIMVNGTCPTIMPSSTPTPTPTSASPHPTTSSITSPTNPVTESLSIVPAAAGGAIAGIVIAALAVVLSITFVCLFCPCGCCMSCRRMCCGCCPEEMICYKCGDGDKDYGEPTPHYEKQPVKETKEKDVETGQPSYPAGPMYQDPNTIQRQAAPSGDLYAQPEKPARHQKQKPAIEMATYQDPNTIQRQAAPTGDLYAQPDKPTKQPPGPAPVYSQVKKPQAGGMEYADLSHSEAPPNARRPAPVADTFYAEVRESRP